MGSSLEFLVAFIQAHAAWAGPIAFVIAFLKALAFVSLVVPGMTILLAIGTLIGVAHIPFLPVWIGVSLGAALGDWVSYAVGWRLKDRARHFGRWRAGRTCWRGPSCFSRAGG